MSARAAWRLKNLGFRQVFRYTAGKQDWAAMGWPMEGKTVTPTVGDVIRPDIPTCGLHERITDIRRRLQVQGWQECVVVNEQNVVLGRLRPDTLHNADPQATTEAVMEEGPTSYRPSRELAEAVKRMADKNVDSLLVTNSDGQLLGILYREEAEARLQNQPEKETEYT